MFTAPFKDFKVSPSLTLMVCACREHSERGARLLEQRLQGMPTSTILPEMVPEYTPPFKAAVASEHAVKRVASSAAMADAASNV